MTTWFLYVSLSLSPFVSFLSFPFVRPLHPSLCLTSLAKVNVHLLICKSARHHVDPCVFQCQLDLPFPSWLYYYNPTLYRRRWKWKWCVLPVLLSKFQICLTKIHFNSELFVTKFFCNIIFHVDLLCPRYYPLKFLQITISKFLWVLMWIATLSLECITRSKGAGYNNFPTITKAITFWVHIEKHFY